tara:strand:- start:157 stop:486 length:330 start_codon:yes stop_codon:yes gene_type:complete
MIKTNLIKDFKTIGINEALIRSIINRCIQQCLQETLGTINDLSTLEYCPVWKRDRRKKSGKYLKSLRVRISGEKIYHEIQDSNLKKSGLVLLEVHEFLKRSDAKKATLH